MLKVKHKPTNSEKSLFKRYAGRAIELARWSFCKGPGFSYQYSENGSQPSLTPVPGDPMPYSDLHRHQACLWYIYT